MSENNFTGHKNHKQQSRESADKQHCFSVWLSQGTRMLRDKKVLLRCLCMMLGLILVTAFESRVVIGQQTVSASSDNQASAGSPLSVMPTPVSKGLPPPQWEIDAGGKMSFEVASVRQSVPAHGSGSQPTSNVPLDPGAAYTPTGGLLQATNTPLISYIAFAYRLNLSQAQAIEKQLPKWAVAKQYDIQARAAGNPTKDQLRLMMQSLLAERFDLAVHREMKTVPVYALVLAKPSKLGPSLQPHPPNSQCTEAIPAGKVCSTCSLAATPPTTNSEGLPATCGGVVRLPVATPGVAKVGGRNLTMLFIANSLAGMGRLDRPITDETGLTGTYDFTIQWSPQMPMPMGTGTPPPVEDTGPTFIEAMRTQLGLNLKPEDRPAPVMLLDRVAPLKEN